MLKIFGAAALFILVAGGALFGIEKLTDNEWVINNLPWYFSLRYVFYVVGFGVGLFVSNLEQILWRLETQPSLIPDLPTEMAELRIKVGEAHFALINRLGDAQKRCLDYDRKEGFRYGEALQQHIEPLEENIGKFRYALAISDLARLEAGIAPWITFCNAAGVHKSTTVLRNYLHTPLILKNLDVPEVAERDT